MIRAKYGGYLDLD